MSIRELVIKASLAVQVHFHVVALAIDLIHYLLRDELLLLLELLSLHLTSANHALIHVDHLLVVALLGWQLLLLLMGLLS